MGSKQSKDGKIRLALVGPKGCGKSAFVNAIRGFPDEHEHAAKVDVDVDILERHDYTYPTNPLVIFCDLPGYEEANYPNLETYWNTYVLEKFDGLLIFTKDEITEFDRALAKKVKSFNKSFLIIRAHIDIYISKIQREDEEEHLEKVKDDIVENLRCKREDIFLISNYNPNQWDFFHLSVTIIHRVVPLPQTGKISGLNEEYLAEAKEHILKNGVSGIEELLKKKLEGWKDLKIRFGITGDAGTGKSAFINAIRGLRDDDDGAAKVGVVETTTEPTEYKHPDNPKIIFVDLPGIGTPNYPDFPTYCKKVGLEDYDTFLIFISTRFTKNDKKLAEKVKSIRKSFFLIRTKIDDDCRPKERKSAINEEEILEKIRNDCVKNAISSENDIFLISNYDKEKWDFDRLVKAISDVFPVCQRECLTLSLSNLTRGCLKRKAAFFKAQAVAVAAVSGVASAIPIPGVGAAVDLSLIFVTITSHYRKFGLNDITSENLGILNKKYSEIIKKYSFNSATQLISTMVSKRFGLITSVEEVSKYCPFIGPIIAGSLSFAMTFRYLTRSINEMEEAALVVWDHAVTRSNQDNLKTSTVIK